MRYAKMMIALLIIGCAKQPSTKHPSVADELVFFRHQKSGLCFAYAWGGNDVHGGPMLTTVPCENVKDLLSAPPVAMGTMGREYN